MFEFDTLVFGVPGRDWGRIQRGDGIPGLLANMQEEARQEAYRRAWFPAEGPVHLRGETHWQGGVVLRWPICREIIR